ncbi:hypothetical protein [Zooshikella ganghwensis]|uniref:hypothetical protein n=1 Tax=Zooshikella ganghwensis TaxID=202772 RepID=UPI000482F518|nr:hypothetical protein [Zooshikella ganghwensis]
MERNILEIAIRVGALVLLFTMLQSIPSFYPYLIENEKIKVANVIFNLIPFIVGVSLALLMWFFPNALLKYMSAGQLKEFNASASLETGLVACVGLFVVIYALADLAYHFVFYKLYMAEAGGYGDIPAANKANIFATVVELVLGCILMLRAKLISRSFG